ncbi:BPSL0067 family protein [Burkholderia ubonensis]|uniref:BPSL0067 family protein n=1 Tax=Burkholderia ubonensis TaxID=101571 RepID=UPI00358F0816
MRRACEGPYQSGSNLGLATGKNRQSRFKGKDRNGRYIDPSNNADAFSVVR